ncbi:hypothetical protein HYT92_00780 [Candidatus Pacearchaeota archaeon]|nr:hypothetical protein [Candidatus Pacearchaeota archaeon]
MNANYELFMAEDLSSYIGQWIAICDKKIISHNTDFKAVFKEVKEKCPNKKPLITKVPEKETMIF